ncbi:MFS transporter [Glaciihabitans sp. dw_435]|uniref:MFS transporter n=1 Tax=Glaciihabitans sp. dw_435 TaxID=2720081 RepID=UPI001BD62DE3|nr:MFS transporter [Glaciihabitans sp. dw_435]
MTETNLVGSAHPLPAPGLDSQAGKTIPRSHIAAWAFWDWGGAAFNAVIVTFVFSVYLTDTPAFGGTTYVTAMLGWATAGAGLIIAVLAPVTGQRSDGSGRRKLWLAVNTAAVIVTSALLFFVEPRAELLVLGLFLIAAGTIFFELASVNYNAMLAQVSTPSTIGKISGFGWSMGYFGGIVLLLILYFGFIHPDVGLFGVTDANGLSVRVSMLLAALWFTIFSLPIFFTVPEFPKSAATLPRVGFFRSYGVLFRDIAALWRTNRQTVIFLISSAIFRDGLTGVFTFGGVLAAGSFGFSSGDVIVFAIVANLIAGVSTLLIGRLDDRLGAKFVMVFSISGAIVAGLALLIFSGGGTGVFWIFGLLMCIFVGPAQSASRTFLARVIPAGREGEVFGLYATTGKAATFLAPSLFALAVTLFNGQIWGILGIVLVLAVGLVLLIPVKAQGRNAA